MMIDAGTRENRKANRLPRRPIEAIRLACTATGLSPELPVALRPLTVEAGVPPVSEESRDRRHRRTVKSGPINNTVHRHSSSVGYEIEVLIVGRWPKSPR